MNTEAPISPPAIRRRPRALAVAFFLLGALAYWTVRSVDDQRFLRSAERALGEATGVSFELTSARIRLGREIGLSVQGIRIVEPSTGEVLIEADGVLLGLKLGPLRHGRLEFGALQLRSPRIHLSRNREGELNLTPLLDRLALRDEPIAVDVPVPLGRRIPSTLKLDTFRLEAAQLTWRDDLEETPRRRTVLGPLTLFAVRDGRPFGLTFTLEALANPDTVHARIALEGALAGSEDLAWFGDLKLDARGEVQGLHLGEAGRLLERATGLDLELDGLLDADFRYCGALVGDFEGHLDLRARDARWFVPALWRRPLGNDRVTVRSDVHVVGDDVRFEELSFQTEHALIEGELAFGDLSSDDPWIETDVSSPAMPLDELRHFTLPGLIDSDVTDHLVEVIDGGWVRVERFRGAGRVSEWDTTDTPANYDVMFGDFVFSDVSGLLFEGMERITGLGGRMLLVDGDLRFENFTGRYGQSELTRIDGAVVEILGDDTRLDVTLDEGDIQIAELRDFLAHEVFGDEMRAFLDTLGVGAGRATHTSFAYRTDFEDAMDYEGSTLVEGLAVTLLEHGLTFEEVNGPVSFDSDRFETEALTGHFGQSRFTLGGTLEDYTTEARVEVVVDTPLLEGRDLYRLLGNGEAPADAGSLDGRFWLTGPLEVPPALGIEAELHVTGLDLAPPLEAEGVTDATGSVILTSDDLRFDLEDVVWRAHHVRATGEVRDIWTKTIEVEVQMQALEEIDLAGLIGSAPPVDETEPTTEADDTSEPTDPTEVRVVGHFEADRAVFRDTQLSTVTGSFLRDDERLLLDPLEGYALGGPFAGSMEIRTPSERDPRVALEFGVDTMDAGGLLHMLAISRPQLDGRISGSAQLSMAWPPLTRLEQLDGHVTLEVSDGRIHEGIFLWKVFDLLDLPRLLSNPIDVWKTGLGFDRIHGELLLDAGRLSTTALEIEGGSADLVLAGQLDLVTKELDGVVTVAPLGLVDRLLDPLPQVGPLDPNSLTDYAFRVTGPVDGADVRLEALDRVQGFLDRLIRGRRDDQPEEDSE